MKLKSIIFGIAIAAITCTSFTSCSPQSVDDIHAEQNMDKDMITKLPTNG